MRLCIWYLNKIPILLIIQDDATLINAYPSSEAPSVHRSAFANTNLTLTLQTCAFRGVRRSRMCWGQGTAASSACRRRAARSALGQHCLMRLQILPGFSQPYKVNGKLTLSCHFSLKYPARDHEMDIGGIGNVREIYDSDLRLQGSDV